MTRSLRNGTAAALLAGLAMIGPVATSPAQAGGQFGITVSPNGPEADLALRAGLALYGIIEGKRSSGAIRQRGHDNSAGIAQDGGGHYGIVHQEGRGHHGTIEQTGRNNAYGLFQFGRNTNATVRQHGHGGSGITFQFGY